MIFATRASSPKASRRLLSFGALTIPRTSAAPSRNNTASALALSAHTSRLALPYPWTELRSQTQRTHPGPVNCAPAESHNLEILRTVQVEFLRVPTTHT